MVERADPGSVVEIMRLRDKLAAREEQARRAQRTAAEAQEAVGRETAINQVAETTPLLIVDSPVDMDDIVYNQGGASSSE